MEGMYQIPLLKETIFIQTPSLIFDFGHRKNRIGILRNSLKKLNPSIYPDVTKINAILDAIYSTSNIDSFNILMEELKTYDEYLYKIRCYRRAIYYVCRKYYSLTHILHEFVELVNLRIGEDHHFSQKVHKLYESSKLRRDCGRYLYSYEDMLHYINDYMIIRARINDYYDEYFTCHAPKQTLWCDLHYAPNRSTSIQVLEANPYTNPVVCRYLKFH